MDTEELLATAIAIAEEVGGLHMLSFRKPMEVRWKGVADPVTDVDLESERLIARRITASYPEHAIVGEEKGALGDASGEYVWYCDPLDGTENFRRGLPVFCVSLGIYRAGNGVVGVVHAPALGETYWAERGGGAYCNGDRIRVSARTNPLESVLASGFSTGARLTGENLREWTAVLRAFQAVRRMGSAALDLSWVAAGRYEGFWEYGLKPWDVAAGCLIVREAGGVVSDMEGRPHHLDGSTLVAGSERMHSTIVKHLRSAGASDEVAKLLEAGGM